MCAVCKIYPLSCGTNARRKRSGNGNTNVKRGVWVIGHAYLQTRDSGEVEGAMGTPGLKFEPPVTGRNGRGCFRGLHTKCHT